MRDNIQELGIFNISLFDSANTFCIGVVFSRKTQDLK